MKRIAKTFGLSVCILGVLAMMCPAQSEAVVVLDAFLFSTWSTPPNVSSPSFLFSPTDGVRLTLNASGVPTAQVDVNAQGPFSINSALTYISHTGTINSGESGGTTAAHVNSEVGTLDDVGIFSPSIDQLLNLDFGDNAAVIFALPGGGLTYLMIAEDAGLDPLKLELCSNATCTTTSGNTVQTLFNWSSSSGGSVLTSVLSRSDFDAADDAAIDQAYLFHFGSAATGWARLTETTNPSSSSERLEVDFLGGGRATPPPTIPEPASLLLFSMGSLGAGFMGRRKRFGIVPCRTVELFTPEYGSNNVLNKGGVK